MINKTIKIGAKTITYFEFSSNQDTSFVSGFLMSITADFLYSYGLTEKWISSYYYPSLISKTV
jgi:hypothetical protein